MTQVERDIFIQASATDILEYAGNPANIPDYYVGVVEVESDYETPHIGGTVTQIYTVAGQRMEMTLEIIDYVPEESITMKMDGMIKGTFRWDYIPENDGTRVKASVDYTMSGGILGKIADKLVVENMNISQLEQSLANLKAKMES